VYGSFLLNIREPFPMGCVFLTQQDLHNFYTIHSYGMRPMGKC